jgi:DNA polymerase-3 subunit alpha
VTPGFVHLHVHTQYSIVDSVVRIPSLMTACREAGKPAVAITDQNNMFGMVKFYRAALANGLKPLIGVDINVESANGKEPAPLVLLCRNSTGYANLTRLVTLAYVDGTRRGDPVVQRKWLQRDSLEGLVALSGASRGDLGQLLLDSKPDLAERCAAEYQELFNGDYFIELQRTGRPTDNQHLELAVNLASSSGFPVVATNDVRFVLQSDYEAHEVKTCIQQSKLLSDASRPRLYSEQQYLRGPEEMLELFSDIPEALENSVEIAKRCNLAIEIGKSYLPDYEVPAGQTADSFLRVQSEEGLKSKLELISASQAGGEVEQEFSAADYDSRLDIELDVICRMGFPGYFLIVADFIEWARNNGVPVGPGRGSGAGSRCGFD